MAGKAGGTFLDPDLVLEGGESSREATERTVNVIEGILADGTGSTVVVTHGKLLLKHFDNNRYGFETWKRLTNPDIFLLERADGETFIRRMRVEK
ncbi:MAG TPA: histidine phosphatase family protein [Bacillota bacterium]|nr:histidine phosphatase family protein [Bacillota bacterium]